MSRFQLALSNFWDIFENKNCCFECRNFFFALTFFTTMSKFVLFSVGLVFPVIMSRLQVVLCNGTSGLFWAVAVFWSRAGGLWKCNLFSVSSSTFFDLICQVPAFPSPQKSLACINANKQTIQSLRILEMCSLMVCFFSWCHHQHISIHFHWKSTSLPP